jgi:hypothetical protein
MVWVCSSLQLKEMLHLDRSFVWCQPTLYRTVSSSSSSRYASIFRLFISTSTSPCIWTHSSLSYPLNPSIFKSPTQSTSPHFFNSCCSMLFVFLSSSHFRFTIISKIFSPLFTKIPYMSTEYVLSRTCVLYLTVHITDTELSVHV